MNISGKTLILDNNDCENILQELRNIYNLTEDTDLTQLNVPVLLAYLKWVEKNSIDIADIVEVKVPVKSSKLGMAILVHLQEFIKFQNK